MDGRDAGGVMAIPFAGYQIAPGLQFQYQIKKGDYS
jgi:hypothetical protein